MVEATGNGLSKLETAFDALTPLPDNLDIEGEEFPFPQQVTRESFNYNLDRLGTGEFDVDNFLFSNYRYTSLDDLSGELKGLLKELDTELVNLVNNDYSDFINLGKSMDGSVDLIHNIKVDVGDYQKELARAQAKLNTSEEVVDSILKQKRQLGQLKYIANAMLLLNDQVESAETIFSTRSTERVSFEMLQELTTIYLSIHKILQTVDSSSEMMNSLSRRISTLRYDYKGLLDEYARGLDLTKKDEVLSIMKMYIVLGEPGDFTKIIRETKAATTAGQKND